MKAYEFALAREKHVTANMEDLENSNPVQCNGYAARTNYPQAQPTRGDTDNGAIVQRAIAIGTEHLPRTLDIGKLQLYFSQTQIQEILNLNAEREKIYRFQNNQHFINYFTTLGGFPPTIENVSLNDLQQGHEMANMLRFGTINQPSQYQVPSHAPGFHNIPQQQLPPSGPGHTWANTTQGGNQQYTIWSNQLQPPVHPTEFNTFGNPNNPSVWTHQGSFNMGGRVQPTSSPYLVDVSRSQTTYGHLDSETNFVRGHPMSLKQQQKSTEPNSNSTFDNTGIVYTRESDGTKGGLSTFRYNAVERPSEQSMKPFNQVNVSSNPYGQTGMGISQVDKIHFSMQHPNNSYEQLEFDNTVDYRTQIGSGNKFHSRLKQHVQSNNFPYEEVYKPGRDYMEPNRHSYPGYMSPPPTPFLIPQHRETETDIVLKGVHHQNEIILHDGDAWMIVEAKYDKKKDKTSCKIEKAFTSQSNFF